VIEHRAVGLAAPEPSFLTRVWHALHRREIMGYLVWGAMGVIIAVPEIWAAAASGLPWQTISSSVGTGLTRDHTYVSLVVVIVLVIVGYYSFRYPLTRREPTADAEARTGTKVRERPYRRMERGGRLTLSTKRQPDADTGLVGTLGIVYFFATSAVIAGATILTDQISSGSPERYHASYVLYGLIALFWILVPSVVALTMGHEAPWPTLFVTIKNLETRLGPLFGSLAAAMVVAGLAILLLHLVLYPFPDITHILNPDAR
jgi:hypothetical protein